MVRCERRQTTPTPPPPVEFVITMSAKDAREFWVRLGQIPSPGDVLYRVWKELDRAGVNNA